MNETSRINGEFTIAQLKVVQEQGEVVTRVWFQNGDLVTGEVRRFMEQDPIHRTRRGFSDYFDAAGNAYNCVEIRCA